MSFDWHKLSKVSFYLWKLLAYIRGGGGGSEQDNCLITLSFSFSYFLENYTSMSIMCFYVLVNRHYSSLEQILSWSKIYFQEGLEDKWRRNLRMKRRTIQYVLLMSSVTKYKVHLILVINMIHGGICYKDNWVDQENNRAPVCFTFGSTVT